jgi:hypothetical protein
LHRSCGLTYEPCLVLDVVLLALLEQEVHHRLEAVDEVDVVTPAGHVLQFDVEFGLK